MSMINTEYKLTMNEMKAYHHWVAKQIPKQRYKNIDFQEWIMFGAHGTGGGIGQAVHVRREYKNGDVLICDITDYLSW